jgi:hypothetical protein
MDEDEPGKLIAIASHSLTYTNENSLEDADVGLASKAQAQAIADAFRDIAKSLDGDVKAKLLENASKVTVLGSKLALELQRRQQEEVSASPDVKMEDIGEDVTGPVYKEAVDFARDANTVSKFLEEHNFELFRGFQQQVGRAIMMYMETLPGTNNVRDLALIRQFASVPGGVPQGISMNTTFCSVAEYMEARVEWRMAYNLYLHGSLVIEMGFAFDDLDFDHTRLEEQNAQLQDRNNTLQLANTRLEEQNGQLGVQNAQLQDRNNTLQLANTHLEVQNAPLQERNNILQAQVDSLQTQLRDLSIRHEKEKENSGRPDLSQLSAHEFYQHFGAVFEQSKKFILPSEGVTPKVPASSATAGQADTTNIPTPSSKLLPTEMYIDTLVQGSSAPIQPGHSNKQPSSTSNVDVDMAGIHETSATQPPTTEKPPTMGSPILPAKFVLPKTSSVLPLHQGDSPFSPNQPTLPPPASTADKQASKQPSTGLSSASSGLFPKVPALNASHQPTTGSLPKPISKVPAKKSAIPPKQPKHPDQPKVPKALKEPKEPKQQVPSFMQTTTAATAKARSPPFAAVRPSTRTSSRAAGLKPRTPKPATLKPQTPVGKNIQGVTTQEKASTGSRRKADEAKISPNTTDPKKQKMLTADGKASPTAKPASHVAHKAAAEKKGKGKGVKDKK